MQKIAHPSSGLRKISPGANPGGFQTGHAPCAVKIVIKKMAIDCGALYFMFRPPPLTILDPLLALTVWEHTGRMLQ